MSVRFSNQTGTPDADALKSEMVNGVEFMYCKISNRSNYPMREVRIEHHYTGEGGGEDSILIFNLEPGEPSKPQFFFRVGVPREPSDKDLWSIRWQDSDGRRWGFANKSCGVSEADWKSGKSLRVNIYDGKSLVYIEKPTTGACGIRPEEIRES